MRYAPSSSHENATRDETGSHAATRLCIRAFEDGKAGLSERNTLRVPVPT